MTLQYSGTPQMYQPAAFPAAQQPAPWANMPQRPCSPYGAAPVNNGGPSLSAVKIDINGASMDAGGSSKVGNPMPMYPGRAQMMSMSQQQYMPMPQYMPPPPQYMPAPQYVAPQPVPMPQPQFMPPVAMPQVPQPVMQAPIPVPPPVVQQPPAPVMVNNQQQVAESQPTPPPAQVEQTQQPQAAPAVDPAVAPLAQAIDIIAPPPGKQPSLVEQEQAIYTLGQYAKTAMAADSMMKTNPNDPASIEADKKVNNLVNPLLIDEKVFKGLTNIATSNTSAFSGEEKKKADSNKIVAMWTLAMMQKLFRSEMNDELKKRGMQVEPMPIGEVPGVSQIVDNIKSDPNPEVRESGIVALREVADPKNKKDVETVKVILQTAAKQDSSKEVKTTANNAAVEFLTEAGLSNKEIKKAGFQIPKK